jgi:hypothetical protein
MVPLVDVDLYGSVSAVTVAFLEELLGSSNGYRVVRLSFLEREPRSNGFFFYEESWFNEDQVGEVDRSFLYRNRESNLHPFAFDSGRPDYDGEMTALAIQVANPFQV